MAADRGPWLIYALGGGWGHLTRAASLARAAQSRQKVRILTNSPHATRVAKAMPELDLFALDPLLDLADARKSVVRQIADLDPACLIVDTFPRGLGGELVSLFESLAATKVLIHRDLDPRYIAAAGLRGFVGANYDLVLIPGEDEAGSLANLSAARITAPWLIREPQNREPGAHPLVLVCASGNAEELPWYGAVVEHLLAIHPTIDVRCVAATCPRACPERNWVEHWPAADLLSTAHVVVGGAGYNTVSECLAFHIPLIARPWPRKYDRQWLRAERAAQAGQVTIVKEPAEAAAAAAHLLKRTTLISAQHEFRNGAREAVELIDREIVRRRYLRATAPAGRG